MVSPFSSIPFSALALGFMLPGQQLRFTDGWVHTKIVPHTIIAQVLYGHYEIVCDGRTAVIEPGEAFLTPANRLMSITHHGDPECGMVMGARWNHFHFTLFDAIDFTSLLDLPLRVEVEPAGRLGEIIGEYLDNDPPEEDRALRWMARRLELAYETLRILCEIAPLRPESLALIQHSERLAAVFTFIRDHLAQPLSVPQLARAAHMSPSRFHAFFREHIGCTPMDYVKRLRLDEACKRLLVCEDSISQISERIGFCNQFHFSREFKARFGMTPSEYRRSHNSLLV